MYKFLPLKSISIALLFVALNLQAAAQPQISSTAPIDPKATQLEYWPPLISQLEEAYAQHPQDLQIINSLCNAYNNYAVLLAQNKQWSQAESYLEQAITLSPNPVAFKKNLSNIYYEQGAQLYLNHSSSTSYTASNVKALANKAIALDPSNVNGYLLLGDVEYMEQNMPNAQRAWQQAARLVPGNQMVQKRLTQITRETNIETNMNNVYNPYFNIRVDPGVAQNINLDLNHILNFAHDNVAQDFQFYQNFKVPVVVYNRQQYQDAMVDAPGWAEAVYDGKIRIAISPDQTSFKQIISDVCHEYTHVIVGVLTDNNCPRWFNEGLAKYEEYKHGLPPRIYLLAAAYNSNELLEWDKVNDAMLSPNKNIALLAYQQSFSFVYFLVQRNGMYNIIQVLKLLGTKMDFDTAIQKVYGVPITKLQTDWRAWLTPFITNWALEPATTTEGGDY